MDADADTDADAGCRGCGSAPPSRRDFLKTTAAAWVAITLPAFGDREVLAATSELPRRRIGNLSELAVGDAVPFAYPDDGEPNCVLVRLGEPAGGGIGPAESIVAFHATCTHMGVSLDGVFQPKLGVAGPCQAHWTTFDLSRHGTVVSGHATAPLPQVLLELGDPAAGEAAEGIYAVGVRSLFFGHVSA